MLRFVFLFFFGLFGLSPSTALADPDALRPSPAPPPLVTRAYSRNWPLSLDLHVLFGVEPQAIGNPLAFGVGSEFLWRARIGGFLSLLSSEGTPILNLSANGGGKALPSLADRISVPIGLAARPFAWLVGDRDDWVARLAQGVGAQLGVTAENLRTSDDDKWVAGFHVALSVDVPLWGGPVSGGVALRLLARGIFAPSAQLDAGSVSTPTASGQYYFGLCYYP